MEGFLVVPGDTDDDFEHHRLMMTTDGRPYLPRENEVTKVGGVVYIVNQIFWDFDELKILVFLSHLPAST